MGGRVRIASERVTCAEYVVIWLSRFVQSSHFWLGVFVTAGIEWSVGSAMCLMGTCEAARG